MRRLALVFLLLGCQSAPPCICPELELPEVVETIVEKPALLPTPSPPVYLFCSDLASVYHNLDIADAKFLECVAIIEANNEQSSSQP